MAVPQERLLYTVEEDLEMERGTNILTAMFTSWRVKARSTAGSRLISSLF
jgi:hypothetical protein